MATGGNPLVFGIVFIVRFVRHHERDNMVAVFAVRRPSVSEGTGQHQILPVIQLQDESCCFMGVWTNGFNPMSYYQLRLCILG